jgi:4-hydroxy-tetrahydrodipicolinate synthase
MSCGAHGVVSVASNVAPKDVVHLVEACAKGKFDVAQKLHYKLYPLFKDLFIESNPAPVKAALNMMGLCEEEIRLPLVPITSKSREKLAATLKAVGLVK